MASSSDTPPLEPPAEDPVALAIARKLRPRQADRAGSEPRPASPEPAHADAVTAEADPAAAADAEPATAEADLTPAESAPVEPTPAARPPAEPAPAQPAPASPARAEAGVAARPAARAPRGRRQWPPVPRAKAPRGLRQGPPVPRAKAPRQKRKPQAVVAPKATRPLARRLTLAQRVRAAFDASPAYGIAVSVHLVVLLALSFWTIATYTRREIEPVQARLGTSTELVLAETEQTRDLSDMLEAPDLAVELNTADPFHEALGAEVGPLRADDAAIGLSGATGGGYGRGGQADRRGGASSASDGAVHMGLEWLVRHRTPEGLWHELPANHLTSGRIGHGGDVARTGLAVLCFLASDQDHVEPGPYREVVAHAVRWLTGQIDRDGQFKNGGHPWAGFYRQAIGTLALSEALAIQEDAKVRATVTAAVAYLERTRERDFGWRYQPRTDTDTSVTSWVTLALKSADAAGVAVEPACFEGVRNYLETVSTQAGTTGYTHRGDPNPGMNATGLFLRIMLGEPPTTVRNRAAAEIVGGTRLWVRGGEIENLYQLYYAALGMYQVGGEAWQEFNPKVRDALVGAQRQGSDHRAGSWPHGGYTQDPILSTCFAILTLETYYRYLPVHGGLELDAERERSPAEEQLDRAAVAMGAARERKDGGSLLAAEAAYQGVLELLGDERDPARTTELELEVRGTLVEIALLQGDEALALSRAQQYLGAVPSGQRGEPGIRRLALMGAYKDLMARARELYGPGREPTPAQVDGLRLDLQALQQRLARERGWLGNELQDLLDRIGPGLDQLAAKLEFEANPEQALEAARAALDREPASGAVGAREVRAFTGLLQRAHGRFQLAAQAGDRTAFSEGERDLAWVRARDLARLDARQRQALDPLYRQVMLARLGALLGLGLTQQVLEGVAGYRVVHPDHDDAALSGLERAALAAEVQAGRASAGQRARLDALLLAWSRSDPPLEPNARLALADTLRAAGEVDEAARQYEQALAPAAPAAAQQVAHLALASIRREQGDLGAALRHLEAIAGPAAKTFEVRFERCALLRATGRPQEALTEYATILRALGGERGEPWWRVAEAMAFAFGEAGDVAGGTRFLEELRQLDPTYGRDEARKERLAALLFDFLKRG